jgi:hypothetical protein
MLLMVVVLLLSVEVEAPLFDAAGRGGDVWREDHLARKPF